MTVKLKIYQVYMHACQSKRSDTEPLSKVFEKCNKEDMEEDAEQPIYICIEEESIKCKWCPGFKGSREARVVNQHTKNSKSHLSKRQQHLHPEEFPDPLEGVQDIRTYFNS